MLADVENASYVNEGSTLTSIFPTPVFRYSFPASPRVSCELCDDYCLFLLCTCTTREHSQQALTSTYWHLNAISIADGGRLSDQATTSIITYSRLNFDLTGAHILRARISLDVHDGNAHYSTSDPEKGL